MSSSIKQAVLGLRKHLSGAAYLIIQPLILNAISIPVLALILRSLGPTGYGEWYTATTLVGTLAFLSNLGLRMHFVRGVAQDHQVAPVALAEQLGVRSLLASAAALICVAVCVFLRYPAIVLECTAVSAIGLVFVTVQTTFADLFQALGKLKELATFNLISGLILTGASVVVAWAHWGPLSMAAAYLIGPILWMILGVWYTREKLFHFTVHWNLVRFKEILWQSRVLGMQLFVSNVGNQVENLLVPKIAGFASNGFLGAGTALPNRLSVVSDGLSTAFYPVMARNYKVGPAHLIRSCLMYLAASVGLCVPVAIVIMLIARPLSHFLFPHSANTDILRTVMIIAIWVLPINAIAAVMGYTLNACGREKAEFKAALISNICGLIIAILFIAKFGLIGACWSLITRYTLSVLVRIAPFMALILPMLRAHSREETTPVTAHEPVAAPAESIP